MASPPQDDQDPDRVARADGRRRAKFKVATTKEARTEAIGGSSAPGREAGKGGQRTSSTCWSRIADRPALSVDPARGDVHPRSGRKPPRALAARPTRAPVRRAGSRTRSTRRRRFDVNRACGGPGSASLPRTAQSGTRRPEGSAVDANHRRHYACTDPTGRVERRVGFAGSLLRGPPLVLRRDRRRRRDARRAARARRGERRVVSHHFTKIIHDILCELHTGHDRDRMHACPARSSRDARVLAADVDVEKALDAESARKTLFFPDTITFVKITHRVSPGTVVFHDWRGERQNPSWASSPPGAACRVVSAPR